MAESKIDLVILALTADFIAESDTILREENLSNQMRDRISQAMLGVFTLTTLAYGRLAELGVYPGYTHLSEYVSHALNGVSTTAVRGAYGQAVERIREKMVAMLDHELVRVRMTAWREAFAVEE